MKRKHRAWKLCVIEVLSNLPEGVLKFAFCCIWPAYEGSQAIFARSPTGSAEGQQIFFDRVVQAYILHDKFCNLWHALEGTKPAKHCKPGHRNTMQQVLVVNHKVKTNHCFAMISIADQTFLGAKSLAQSSQWPSVARLWMIYGALRISSMLLRYSGCRLSF